MINLGQSLRDAGTWNILAPWIKDIACTVLPGIQCRLVQEAPHLYCLEISAYLDQDLPIGSF